MTIAMERAARVSRHHVAVRTFGPINPDIAAALGDMGVRVDAEPSPEARIGLILVDGGSIKRSTSRFGLDTLARPTRALRNVVVSSLTDLVLDTDVDRVLVVCTPGIEPTEPVIFKHWFGQVCADSWYHLTMNGGLPAPSITSKLFSNRASCDYIANAVTSWCGHAEHRAEPRPWQ
ncbi:hypothetical protein RND64_22240 [Gordonia sp. w5E2]|nr:MULTISPECIES: hypothetical protein [Gordonia]SKZ12015.1 Uncharacterised protein [Mycobacteroides abscessus subsp. abscessus]